MKSAITEQEEQIMEILRDRPWIDLSMVRKAGPITPIHSIGSPTVVEALTGAGSITFTITVPA
jgi:hypothetical protein